MRHVLLFRCSIPMVFGILLFMLSGMLPTHCEAARASSAARTPKSASKSKAAPKVNPTAGAPVGVEIRAEGITPAYQKAIKAVTAEARSIYASTLHCEVPQTVYVNVKVNPSGRTMLWTDGESQMFLTIKSISDLAPPRQSGIFNIYGLCHEIGHIAMYRRIRMLGLPAGVGQGWAHYAGSVVTSEVYKKLGKSVWPVPYDFSEDGLTRLERQMQSPDALKDPETKAAAAFYSAQKRFGVDKVFAAMNEATVDKPQGKDVMTRFLDALVKNTGDESARKLFSDDLVIPAVDWQVDNREISFEMVSGVERIKDDTGVVLKYDDGRSDGKRSTAGAGHAVVFRRPDGDWAIDSVRIFGSRYGESEAPKENFSIYICDEYFGVLKEIQVPYGKLEIGEDKWHQFDFEPVQVPEGFYVCVYFDPTATKGFYMNFDRSVKKSHSKAALPWTFVHDLGDEPMDWMLRVHLKRIGD